MFILPHSEGRCSLVRTLFLAIPALVLSACSSGNSSLSDVPVSYRFENVRTDAKSDELIAIKGILEEHASKPVEVNTGTARTVDGVQIRTITARIVVPSLAAIDAIQADLEEYIADSDPTDRPEWSLVDLNVAYRSNVVAAAVSAMISGFATAGYGVKIYTMPDQPPVSTKAAKNGLWTAKITTMPESGWVYGVATDPTGRDKPAYFRVNTTTKRQERVDPSDFESMFPPPPPPPPPPTKPKA